MKWCGKELLKFSFGQQDYEQLQCAIWTQALEQEQMGVWSKHHGYKSGSYLGKNNATIIFIIYLDFL